MISALKNKGNYRVNTVTSMLVKMPGTVCVDDKIEIFVANFFINVPI